MLNTLKIQKEGNFCGQAFVLHLCFCSIGQVLCGLYSCL